MGRPKFELGDRVVMKTGYEGVVWRVRARWREHSRAPWLYKLEAQEPYGIDIILANPDVEEPDMEPAP